ncbi:hypothetical protein M9458_039407, partial [Cirrhinus mrigala]
SSVLLWWSSVPSAPSALPWGSLDPPVSPAPLWWLPAPPVYVGIVLVYAS